MVICESGSFFILLLVIAVSASRVVCSLLLHLRLHLDTSLRGARRPGWPPLQPRAGHGLFCSTVSPTRRRPNQANARHKTESKCHSGLASRGEGWFHGRNRPMQQRKTLVLFSWVMVFGLLGCSFCSSGCWSVSLSSECPHDASLFRHLRRAPTTVGFVMLHHSPNNRR